MSDFQVNPGVSGYRAPMLSPEAAAVPMRAGAEGMQVLAKSAFGVAEEAGKLLDYERRTDDDILYRGGLQGVATVGEDAELAMDEGGDWRDVFAKGRVRLNEGVPQFHDEVLGRKFVFERDASLDKLEGSLADKARKLGLSQAKGLFNDSLASALEGDDYEESRRIIRSGEGRYMSALRAQSLLGRVDKAQRDAECMGLADKDPALWTENFNAGVYGMVTSRVLAESRNRVAMAEDVGLDDFGVGVMELVEPGKDVLFGGGAGSGGSVAGTDDGFATGGSSGGVSAGVRSLAGDVAARGDAVGGVDYESLVNAVYDEVERIDMRRFPGGVNGREYQVRRAAGIKRFVQLGVSQSDARGAFDYLESQSQAGSLKGWGGEAELWDYMEKNNLLTPAGKDVYVSMDHNGNYMKSADMEAHNVLARNKIAIRSFASDWRAEHPDANVREYLRAMDGFVRERSGKSLPFEDLLMLRKGELSKEEVNREGLALRVDREVAGVKRFEEGLLDGIHKGETFSSKAVVGVNTGEDFDGLLVGQDIIDRLGVMGTRDVAYALQLPNGVVYRPQSVKVVPGNRFALGRKAAARLRVFYDRPLKGEVLLSVPAFDWREARERKGEGGLQENAAGDGI